MNRLGQCLVKDYSHYAVEDFVLDQFFRAWVLNPDVATTLFWEQWLKTHPEKSVRVEEAKKIIEILSYPCYQLSDNEIKELWRRIKNSKH